MLEESDITLSTGCNPKLLLGPKVAIIRQTTGNRVTAVATIRRRAADGVKHRRDGASPGDQVAAIGERAG